MKIDAVDFVTVAGREYGQSLRANEAGGVVPLPSEENVAARLFLNVDDASKLCCILSLEM